MANTWLHTRIDGVLNILCLNREEKRNTTYREKMKMSKKKGEFVFILKDHFSKRENKKDIIVFGKLRENLFH